MRPLTIQISNPALIHNLNHLKEYAPHARLCAVVKANAYGHQAGFLIDTLNQHADFVAVASLEEAISLRYAGINHVIIILQGIFEADEYKLCAAHEFAPVISNSTQLHQFASQLYDQPLNIWLKVDTGMHRLGFPPNQLPHYLKILHASKQVSQLNLMSHLACADLTDHPLTERQIRVFSRIDYAPFSFISLANSAATLRYPNTHLNLVRTGLIMYGISPIADKTGAELGFKPVMNFYSKLIDIKKINARESVGYGATYTATKVMTIGVVACGYADGYPREISEEAYVLIDNHYRAPIIGRISMDMLSVDLTAYPDAHIGSIVILWGNQLPIELVAKWANTIPYTLVTGLNQRIRFEPIDA